MSMPSACCELDAVTTELLLERRLAEPRVAGHVVADLPLVDALGPGHDVRGEADHALVRLDGARHVCSLPLVPRPDRTGSPTAARSSRRARESHRRRCPTPSPH